MTIFFIIVYLFSHANKWIYLIKFKKHYLPSQNIEIVYEETVARLIVLETYSEHVGDYCCWAKNPYGSLSTHCRLELEVANKKESRAFEGPVSHEPRIVSLTPRSVSVVRGSVLSLTLGFEGEPAPQVAWILNGRQLASGEDDNFKYLKQLSTLSML
ncbi:hypothetical protein Btru_047905 [Bulinus truncatus]|nr:hypothetical protein Btru_047905 [Bulinus truncatus]